MAIVSSPLKPWLPEGALSSRYVYYKTLEDDPYNPEVADVVRPILSKTLDEARQAAVDTSILRQLAASERTKELSILRNVFGQTIGDEYSKPSIANETLGAFIRIFNYSMGVKEIYQRRLKIINETEQKESISWVASELATRLKKNHKTMDTIICSKKTNQQKAILLKQHLVDRAWEVFKYEMYGNKGPNGLKNVNRGDIANDPVLSVYKEIKDYLESDPKLENKYKQMVFDALQLDETVNEMVKQSNSTLAADNLLKGSKGNQGKIFTTAGTMDEILKAVILDYLSKNIHKEDKIKSKGFHTGAMNTSADNIQLFGCSVNLTKQLSGSTKRHLAVKRYNKLGEKINEMFKGDPSKYIVYYSEKNYTMNKDQFYHAGTLTLDDFSKLMNNAENRMGMKTTYDNDEVIGAILNVMPGTLGEGENINRLRTLLTQYLAYVLFDDYVSIGAEIAQDATGDHAIHVMDLNGIMVPLSVLLELLANAIDEMGNKETNTVAGADIHYPELMYKGNTAEEVWADEVKKVTGDNEKKPKNKQRNLTNSVIASIAWANQRKYALTETKVLIRFLRNFRHFVTTNLKLQY